MAQVTAVPARPADGVIRGNGQLPPITGSRDATGKRAPGRARDGLSVREPPPAAPNWSLLPLVGAMRTTIIGGYAGPVTYVPDIRLLPLVGAMRTAIPPTFYRSEI